MEQHNFYQDLLGLPDLKITSVERYTKKIILHCHLENDLSICPTCGEPTSIVNQKETRKIRDLDISGKEVWLHLKIRQFICYPCNRYFNECPDWVESRKTYTKRQAKWVFELCAKQPFKEVGAQTNMCPKTVERLYYELAQVSINLKERYKQVRKLGIDEISKKKGKKDYACVLTDLERGIQLDVLKDRKKETLLAHFQSLGSNFCSQIEVVSCDMWKTYINVSKECFVNASIVIDRFHVVKSLNEVLDKIRKKLRKEFKEEECFKNIKWKLYKRVENCSEQEYKVLEDALNKSWELAEVYQLRNTFNSMFDIATKNQELIGELDSWIEHASLIGNKDLDRFIKTLRNWKPEIAAFAETGITNAVTEGLNNYLRYFKRISFGLPNFENMRLRILQATS